MYGYRFPKKRKYTKGDKDDTNDSIWSTIRSTAQALNVGLDYVLYEMTFANIMLYTRTIPSEGGDVEEEIIDGDSKESETILKQLEKDSYE